MITDQKNVGGLSPSQEEMAVRIAELLSEVFIPATVMRFLRELDDELGDRGLAELVRLIQTTWREDCGYSEIVEPEPTEAEIRRRVEAQFEAQVREDIAVEHGTRLKRDTVCEECGKVRRGRAWIVCTAGTYHRDAICPGCKQKWLTGRNGSRQSARAATLNIVTEDDSEAASGLPDV